MITDVHSRPSNIGNLQSTHDRNYWSTAIANELKFVASNMKVGSRNDQLFRSACNIYSIVKAGIGTHENADDLLIEAASDSGYANDEPQQMMATLESAWRKAQARDLTKKGGDITAPITIPPADNNTAYPEAINILKGAQPISKQANDIIEEFDKRNDSDPRIIKSSGVIGRLIHDQRGTKIQPLNKDSLRHEIDHVAHFISKRDGYIGVPDPIVSHILGAPDYQLPDVKGIRRSPYFAADGRLVYERGYDQITGYYLDLPNNLKIPRIPKYPSFSDTNRALRYLAEVFYDFPFKDKASERAYLSMLLLPFCRDLIQGPLPIYMFAKPAPGTGAGLAVDVFSMIVAGSRATVQAETDSKAEFRKNITAFLLSGEPYFFLDNIHQYLDDPSFAAALTAGIWRDRVLGKSELVDIPINNMWIVAGNNPMLSEELARRSVLMSLDAKMAKPTERSNFRHPRLLDYVAKHRGRLIWACLTLIQSHVVDRYKVIHPSGFIGVANPDRLDEFLEIARSRGLKVYKERGKPGTAHLASFEGWSRTMSGILEAAGVKGLLDNRSNLSDRTLDKTASLSQFIELWWCKFSNSSVKVGSFSQTGNLAPYRLMPDTGTLVELLHAHRGEIDLGFNGKPESHWQTKLGSTLTEAADRVFELEVQGVTTKVRIKKTRGSSGHTYSLDVLD